MKQKLTALLVVLFVTTFTAIAEDYKGKLLLNDTTIGVEGVRVKTKGGVKAKTTTNKLGEFSIKDVIYPFNVRFTLNGYTKNTYTVKCKDDKIFYISLKSQNEQDEKRAITGSSDEVKVPIGNATRLTFIQRLSSVPGVLVRGTDVVIRGGSSVNLSNSPIVIVDGIRQFGPISSLDIPSDIIKSITVVKGAEATTYGLAGANGVIIVKTKTAE